MPVTVVLSDAIARKMQSVATPLVDTYESVIDRAVDALIEKNGKIAGAAVTTGTPTSAGVIAYPMEAPPSLTFSKPTAITLNGQQLDKDELYWNLLLFKVIAIAATKLLPHQLRQALLVNYREGQDERSGFRYIPEAKVSVQGADANGAWKATSHLIRSAQLQVDVVFRWDVKEGAAKPGQIGRMTYEPV